MVGGLGPLFRGRMRSSGSQFCAGCSVEKVPSEYMESRKVIEVKGGDAMMVLEIIGAAAAVITIFSAGVAVGKYLSSNQKDRPQS